MKQDVTVEIYNKTLAAESPTEKKLTKTQTEFLEEILRDIEKEMARNPRAFIIF
jgi:hypothetical protein